MSNFGMKISKEGDNVFTVADKDLQFSSKYDTFKVAASGTITLELSGETLDEEEKNYTESVSHGLGYIPFFMPLLKDRLNSNYATTATWVLNDELEQRIPAGAYGPPDGGESASVYVSSTQITLKVNRYDFSIFGGTTFGAHDVEYYYTIFHNRVDSEFDLL